jgi:hypothetical protein
VSGRKVDHAGGGHAETLHRDPASSRLALPNWVANLRIQFQTGGSTATRHGRRRLLRLYALSLSLVPAHEREWAPMWNRVEVTPQIHFGRLSWRSFSALSAADCPVSLANARSILIGITRIMDVFPNNSPIFPYYIVCLERYWSFRAYSFFMRPPVVPHLAIGASERRLRRVKRSRDGYNQRFSASAFHFRSLGTRQRGM